MHEARTKAEHGKKAGRWRPVARTRVTNDNTDCRGGGVPMGARIVIYADKPRPFGYEGKYDFDWNVEERWTKKKMKQESASLRAMSGGER